MKTPLNSGFGISVNSYNIGQILTCLLIKKFYWHEATVSLHISGMTRLKNIFEI